jgi:diguanylate cyclase
VRVKDNVARYGDEEFISILPVNEIAVAKAIGEQLRQTVKQDNWPTGRITLSRGIATITAGDTDMPFIKKADEALYVLKAYGCNRVTHYHEMK